ncbi:redoxin family protein [candidate division KSB1 bacterium]|nr:redoxin family protein [candidate division KSB1 bacterium]
MRSINFQFGVVGLNSCSRTGAFWRKTTETIVMCVFKLHKGENDMKNNLWFLIVLLLVSCSVKKNEKYQIPQKVIIAGKIVNVDPEKLEVKISANQPGFSQKTIITKIDSLGNFSDSLEIYTPTDLWVTYKTNFLVLIHPGDSVNVIFDGKFNQRPEILKSIQFSGDASDINHDAAKFQQMYFSSPMYTNWDAKTKAAREYDVDQYISYLDTTQQKKMELFQNFLHEVAPTEETIIWAKTYIEEDYFDALVMYPYQHSQLNNLKRDDLKIPSSYYDNLLKRLPISESMLISGYALSSFVNRFHYGYAMKNVRDELEKQKLFIDGQNIPPATFDSLHVYGIIKYTPDELLRQLVLTELFNQRLETSNVSLFENYKDIIDTYIQVSFLKKPLYDLYNKVKSSLEDPQIASDAILKKLNGSSVDQIMENIFKHNKGNIIYLDCWATWCGPCKSEMPHSKKLMDQFKNKDVSFVYLCLDSEEKAWKGCLDEFKLGGQHYFLSKQQSNDMREVFEINGVPYYILINKSETIVEKGSHLRPATVKEKIEKLL